MSLVQSGQIRSTLLLFFACFRFSLVERTARHSIEVIVNYNKLSFIFTVDQQLYGRAMKTESNLKMFTYFTLQELHMTASRMDSQPSGPRTSYMHWFYRVRIAREKSSTLACSGQTRMKVNWHYRPNKQKLMSTLVKI